MALRKVLSFNPHRIVASLRAIKPSNGVSTLVPFSQACWFSRQQAYFFALKKTIRTRYFLPFVVAIVPQFSKKSRQKMMLKKWILTYGEWAEMLALLFCFTHYFLIVITFSFEVPWLFLSDFQIAFIFLNGGTLPLPKEKIPWRR